jgi:hypothetical protein
MQTGTGYFEAQNRGATWGSVNAGLTTFSVNTLAIDPHDTRTVDAGTAITFALDERELP